MFILLYFLLAYDGVFLNKIIRITPRLGDKKRAVSIMREIETQISRYFLTITRSMSVWGRRRHDRPFLRDAESDHVGDDGSDAQFRSLLGSAHWYHLYDARRSPELR